MRHDLKTVNPFFQEVWDWQKEFEVRKNDRNFQIEDELYLHEYCPATKQYSGRQIYAVVVYILTAEQFPAGLQPGYVVLGLGDVDRVPAQISSFPANAGSG